MQDRVTGEDKLDPRYNKYLVRLDGAKDGIDFEKILSYHKCKEEDYDEFYPVGKSYMKDLEEIKTDEKRGMYCVDQFEELESYGIWDYKDFMVVTLDLVPCNYVHAVIGGPVESISEECVANIEDQQAHLS